MIYLSLIVMEIATENAAVSLREKKKDKEGKGLISKLQLVR